MSTNDRTSLFTTFLGVAAALLVVATLGTFLQGWTLRRMAVEERSKVFERPYPTLQTYLQEQEQKLTVGYQWVDREAGIVHLPIDRAMTLVVQEAQAMQEAQTVEEPAGAPATGPNATAAEAESGEVER